MITGISMEAVALQRPKLLRLLNLTNYIEEGREHPLGHPPHRPFLKVIGRERAGDSPDLEREIPNVGGLDENLEGHPPGRGDLLLIGHQVRLTGKSKHKGAGKDRNLGLGTGCHIIERSQQVMSGQGNTNLFPGLSDGGSQKVRVTGIPPSPGQTHVSRPGVPGSFGPSDYEDGVWIGPDDEGDRGLATFQIVNPDRRATVEPQGEKLLQRAQ
jgi:hypothetical protein